MTAIVWMAIKNFDSKKIDDLTEFFQKQTLSNTTREQRNIIFEVIEMFWIHWIQLLPKCDSADLYLTASKFYAIGLFGEKK